MIAWPITARWVLQNGKFVLSIPHPVGYRMSTISNIYTKSDELYIEGMLKTIPEPKLELETKHKNMCFLTYK
jgi:hypothetical protein